MWSYVLFHNRTKGRMKTAQIPGQFSQFCPVLKENVYVDFLE